MIGQCSTVAILIGQNRSEVGRHTTVPLYRVVNARPRFQGPLRGREGEDPGNKVGRSVGQRKPLAFAVANAQSRFHQRLEFWSAV